MTRGPTSEYHSPMSMNILLSLGSTHFYFPSALIFRQYADSRYVLVSIIMSFFKKMTTEFAELKSTFSGGNEKKEQTHEGKIIHEADATSRRTH